MFSAFGFAARFRKISKKKRRGCWGYNRSLFWLGAPARGASILQLKVARGPMLKTSARKPIDIVGLCGQSFAACLAMRPSQSDHEYAQEVVNLSLPYLRRVEDLDATGSGQRLAQKIKWLLTIFNGNWRSKRLVHHCSILCDCGCSDPQEVRFRAVAIYTGFVLGSRPPIPALSKWCKCGLTARWFLFGCGVHHLLQTGFDLLYGISSKGGRGHQR